MALDFIGGAAGGAAEGLEQVLRRVFLEAQQRQQAELAREQMEIQRRGQGVQMRGQDLTSAIARERLGFDQEQQAEDTRRYNIDQPINAKFRAAQTADLERQPLDAADARAHQGMMQERGHLNELAQQENQGKVQGRLLSQRAAIEAAQAKAAAPSQFAAAAPYAAERGNRMLQSVDELDRKVSGMTTGPGSLLSRVPGTDARNFAAELNTLKANIAFGELAEMRAASKTGGALGAVSDRELALLESARGALDPGQSPANFRAQLQKIRESLQRWEQAKAGSGGGGQQPTVQEFDFVPGKGLVPRGGGI